ncbi:acetolactate synthase large subunit [Thiomonas sp. FB-6]|uniref:acetolactate synthase large subunit n=1 Tax=Thiomonas sp. FB-6 TaxID=1158291 RepID=UPI000378D22A|nr:acetolactate synthase large subunit [Thiomonas sp. FB-6]
MPAAAQALLRTLADAGVDVCFTNPGTSEMHFVAALDSEPRMRAVLTLFEGVATGAADGYARMRGRAAATLLHLGCGLGNGLANLHNARKARVPLLNIVGDHASTHAAYDTPLQSDIETVARSVSGWLRRSTSSAELCGDALQALAAAGEAPGQVATLILPADVSWGEGAEALRPAPAAAPPRVDDDAVRAAASALGAGRRAALLLGGRALREPVLQLAARIAAHTGARLLGEVFPARMQRGAGLPPVERLAYLSELASVQLAGVDELLLLDAREPVSFFAYPGKPARLLPCGCRVQALAQPRQDLHDAVQRLARLLDAQAAPLPLQAVSRPPLPRGGLNARKVCQALGHLLPERAIVVDEAQTSGLMLPAFTAGAPAHDLLSLTGGAIGQGLPLALGAAVACPDRPVIALVGDGAAMYTPQALWSMAREGVHVVAVVLNNRAYSILELELQRVGAGHGGARAREQFDLGRPGLDFVRLAEGMGVPARRASTAQEFAAALRHALERPGPHLIEAVVPRAYGGLRLRLLPHLLDALHRLPPGMARAVKRGVAP